MDTVEMATQFPAVGTGFGTFAVAYPLYRSATVRYFYDHAHNDALQALAEGGIVGAVLLLLILIPLIRAVLGALTGDAGLMAVGIAAGLSALLLHGLVDFNFHIPSNAALAAILAGAVFGQRWTPRS
jgi:O-antigen ligase